MIPMHLSIGAAIGPLLAGALAGGNHWGMIFNMLVISDVFSLLFLSRFGKCKNVRFWCKTRCSDNDDSGVQADHERVGEFISFLEKYKAISKLQLNQFLISRLHRANLIWWRFWSNKKITRMMRPSSLQDCDPLIVALIKKHPKVCYTFTKPINHLQLWASDYLNTSLSMIFNI